MAYRGAHRFALSRGLAQFAAQALDGAAIALELASRTQHAVVAALLGLKLAGWALLAPAGDLFGRVPPL